MKKLTPLDQQALLASYVAGEPTTELAKRFKISRQWVSKIVNDFKRARLGIEDIDGVNFKSRLKRKAIVAVESGLDCPDDPYKRARVGTTVLEGIGEFDNGRTQGGGPIEYVVCWGTPQTSVEAGKKVIDVTPETDETEQ